MDILMDKLRLWEVFHMSNQFEVAKRGVAFVANISDGFMGLNGFIVVYPLIQGRLNLIRIFQRS